MRAHEVIMAEDNTTCGQELAEGAVIPEQVALLFAHVAHNMREHARWVGDSNSEAVREHAAMIAVADGYEAISAEAQRMCNFMRSLAHLPAAPHDPATLDKPALVAWLRQKIEIQRTLAQLLSEHATQSEQALRELELV
jgi:tellurite resistance protein